MESRVYGPQQCPPDWFFFLERDTSDPRQTGRYRSEGKEEPFAVFSVKRQMLKHWHRHEYNFVEEFNELLSRNEVPLRLRTDEDSMLRLEERFARASVHVVALFKKAKGGRSKELLNLTNERLCFWKEDFVAPKELQEKIEAHESTIQLQDETINTQQATIEDQRRECEELSVAAEALLDEMAEELREKETEYEENLSAVEALLDQEMHENQGDIGGRLPLRDSGERSVRTKLKSLRTKGQAALAFATCLGIDVHSLILSDRETGKKSVLELGASSDRSSSVKLDLPKASALYGAAAADNTAAPDRSRLDSAMEDHEPDASTRHFSSLSEEKKNEVYSLLYMLDKFYTSDAGYHELTMHGQGDSLSRSYIVKECRKELNSLRPCEIINVHDVRGAQFNFTKLLQDEVAEYLSTSGITGEEDGAPQEEILVKIAGDGATMSRNTSFQMFSFSLLNVGDEVLESTNVRTVVCVSGPETYETLRDGMRDAFEQVNRLVEKKTLDVGNLTVPVTFFLCGDFKYMLAPVAGQAPIAGHGPIAGHEPL